MFGDKIKSPMKIDSGPLQVKEETFVELVDVMMVEITEDSSSKAGVENMIDYVENLKVVY